jgi:hypothetical protein
MYVCMSCRAPITFDMCRSVKTCVTDTGASQAKGQRLAEEGKGAAQPHHVEGKAVFPQNETEMDSFTRCCRR